MQNKELLWSLCPRRYPSVAIQPRYDSFVLTAQQKVWDSHSRGHCFRQIYNVTRRHVRC